MNVQNCKYIRSADICSLGSIELKIKTKILYDYQSYFVDKLEKNGKNSQNEPVII